MVDQGLVAEVIRRTLIRMPLAQAYSDEQRDLQPHIQGALDEALRHSFSPANLRTTISTSFWPDVEVTEDSTHLAAIEVKLIRSRQPASKAIAEAIGQSIIYSIRYPRVFIHCHRPLWPQRQ